MLELLFELLKSFGHRVVDNDGSTVLNSSANSKDMVELMSSGGVMKRVDRDRVCGPRGRVCVPSRSCQFDSMQLTFTKLGDPESTLIGRRELKP